MPEYIEREALITRINDIAKDYFKDGSIQCAIAAGTVIDIRDSVIMKAPTADVVEVVRCKDCIHFSNDTDYCREHNKGYCELDNAIKPPTYFCSYGERKEVDNGHP